MPNTSPEVTFPVVDSFLQLREVSPGVGHALLDGRLHLGRELARVEGLPRADADLGEARHELRLGRIGRAELQDEVQDVEELERGLFFVRRERLDEIDRRRGLGRGWPRNAESGCTL